MAASGTCPLGNQLDENGDIGLQHQCYFKLSLALHIRAPSELVALLGCVRGSIST